jgi:TonB family protein
MRIPVIVLAILLVTTAFAQKTPTPKLLSVPDPDYPKEALALALGNDIQVTMSVDAQGNATYVSVSGPSFPCSEFNDGGITKLRQAAVDAAKKAHFEAATKDGKPIESSALITFHVPDAPEFADNDPGKPSPSESVLNGRAISLPKPAYPAKVRQMMAQGKVSIETLISEQGRVLAVAPKEGNDLLYKTAMIAACGAKFSPTLINGQPIKVHGVITYNFVR